MAAQNFHTPLSLFSALPYSAERGRETKRQGEFCSSRQKKRIIQPIFSFFVMLGSWLCYKQMLLVICSQCREAACRINRLKDYLSLIYRYYYQQRALKRNCKKKKIVKKCVLLFFPPPSRFHPSSYFFSFVSLFPHPELPFGVAFLLQLHVCVCVCVFFDGPQWT